MSILIKIKRLIPASVKRKIHLLLASSNDQRWNHYEKCKKPIIYIFMAGFYPNLGDMAITLAQKKFLQTCYPESEIITVGSTMTCEAVKTIKNIIRPEDIVTIIGGGNMSDLYLSLEECRRYVIKSFSNNKIISFPQTFYFSNTPDGRKHQEISHKVYSNHKDLTIFVREPPSLERITKAFPDIRIEHCPDIVLSLKRFAPQYERHGVLCCFRSDKEQHIESDQKELLIKTVKETFDDVMVKDTVDVELEECIEETYEQTLETFWDMLRHIEVVITDRLHCMIFCVITGTPCVVMDNSNHKNSGVYNAWLQDADFIRFVEKNDAETVIQAAEEIKAIEVRRTIDLSDRFESLRKSCII